MQLSKTFPQTRRSRALLAGLLALAVATPAAASIKSIMGSMGDTTKAAKTLFGTFDQAKAEAILVAYAQQAAAADALVAHGKDAKAKDLHARFMRFAASVEAAKSATADRASFRTAFSAITGECRSCHTVYK